MFDCLRHFAQHASEGSVFCHHIQSCSVVNVFIQFDVVVWLLKVFAVCFAVICITTHAATAPHILWDLPTCSPSRRAPDVQLHAALLSAWLACMPVVRQKWAWSGDLPPPDRKSNWCQQLINLLHNLLLQSPREVQCSYLALVARVKVKMQSMVLQLPPTQRGQS